MSLPVHRLGDTGTGHGCWPPRAIVSGSPNVFANKIPVARLGDAYPPHACPKKIPHGASQIVANNVFANKLPISRTGDPISCGGSALGASPNVNV